MKSYISSSFVDLKFLVPSGIKNEYCLYHNRIFSVIIVFIMQVYFFQLQIEFKVSFYETFLKLSISLKDTIKRSIVR